MVASVQPVDGRDVQRAAASSERGRRWRLGILDVTVLCAAIALFLVFLIALVRVVFPQGDRLGELVGDRSATTAIVDGRGEVGLLTRSTDSIGGFFARLGDVQRDVKVRAADSVAWRSARLGTTLRNRDAVQTFANSRARVDFTTDNELRIGQNSLVVFSSGMADPFLQRREPAVELLGGDLGGAVKAGYGAFSVRFPAGVAELRADETSDDEVRFRVGINPDKSSTIAIYSGLANVSIGNRQYRVATNQGLTVSADGSSAELAALPAIPRVRRPADGAVARFLETPPRVDFRWARVAGAERYRLEIARNRSFDDIVVDDVLSGTSFSHANLAPGDYFWRVSARSGWSLGPASLTRRLRVLRDTQPPALEIRSIDRLATDRYVIRGKAARGATLYVHRQIVEPSADGRFEYVFQPRPGTQTIIVEAIDAVGNVAYDSQVLHVPGRSD